LRIAALFTDYDGTLADDEERREDSQVPRGVAARLRELSRLVPVGVITSKDLRFVRPRTERFATAWSCVGGLETTLAGGPSVVSEGVRDLGRALAEVRRVVPEDVVLEEKRSSVSGGVLGLSVDWTRSASSLDEGRLRRISSILRRSGAHVDWPRGRPYLDAYGAAPDKGLALTRLRRLLAVQGPVIYMGDSPLDNAAFDRSDVAVCVYHGQALEALRCGRVVRYEALEGFLSSLIEGGLDPSGGARAPGRRAR
jgi:hypothetical protein